VKDLLLSQEGFFPQWGPLTERGKEFFSLLGGKGEKGGRVFSYEDKKCTFGREKSTIWRKGERESLLAIKRRIFPGKGKGRIFQEERGAHWAEKEAPSYSL